MITTQTGDNGLQLDCPIPERDFDRITLGHGSGGQLTHKLLDQGVFKLFHNDHLDQRHDGAIIDLKGRTAFSTDSFVVDPIFFPGGNIGDLAVNGTVNDLAMCGASARYLSLGFILEEGLEMNDFWSILETIKKAAAKAGVDIVTGDTKVVDKGKGDKIFINTTGVGPVHPKSDIRVDRVRPGDQVIVSGNLATHGIAIMSVREGLEFESDIRTDSVPLNQIVMKALDEYGPAIHLLRDPTRGGVATVLNEISQQSDTGVKIVEDKLPIDNQVAAACELLGLDPLFVANEGLFVAIVASDCAQGMVELLRSTEIGRNAAAIGRVVEDHPGKLIMQSAIGGERLVKMLVGEQLPRIC